MTRTFPPALLSVDTGGVPWFIQRWLLVIAASALDCLAQAPASALDPAFATIPFEQWLVPSNPTPFLWTARVSGGQLTSTQRLHARVEIQVDGIELAKRRGQGELVFFVQFKDAEDHVFQSHGAIDLKDVTEDTSKSNILYTQFALVIPGEYRVDIVLLDTATGAHAALERTLQVGALRNDPLPDSFHGLPSVEFTSGGEAPEVWFQPQLKGHLYLPVPSREPVRINILMNAAPPVLTSRFGLEQVNSRLMGELLPALKFLSQMTPAQGNVAVSVVDYSRRQVLFTQTHVDPVNEPLLWTKLQPALSVADPNRISVRDLAGSGQNAEFLADQIKKQLDPNGVVIILSGSVDLDRKGSRVPLLENLGNNPGRVFYLRFHPAPDLNANLASLPLAAGRRPSFPRSRIPLEAIDGLEPILKPLRPRVFDVSTPVQVRKALAEIIRQIAQI